MRFDGKVALVTGAASGIGAATAALLEEEGATVVRLDAREADRVDPCDVRDPAQVQAAVREAVARHGGIDLVANVAGVIRFSRFDEITPELWQLQLDVNLTGPFHVIQAALPTLRERRGNVVNVGSVAGLRGIAYQAAYAASKAALIHLTKSLAVEYGAEGVRFNSVCPGTVLTPLLAEVGASIPQDADPRLLGRMQGVMPGMIDPREVAEAIAYVGSDAARSMTGHALTVDLGVVC
jgi:meso-butanediol dehydrogenase/(S,S)-butanediol dehydrogenase/diacetyl reductase